MTGFGVFLFPTPPSDRWTVGWLTGPDGDLVCVQPSITDEAFSNAALSPVCNNLLLAIAGFFLKYVLVRIDRNLWII